MLQMHFVQCFNFVAGKPVDFPYRTWEDAALTRMAVSRGAPQPWGPAWPHTKPHKELESMSLFLGVAM